MGSHMEHSTLLETNMALQMTYFAGKMGQVERMPLESATVIRSDISDDMFNYVLSAQFGDEEASAQIDEIIRLFKIKNLPFSWWVGPSDKPKNLKAILRSKGMKVKEQDVGMILKLEKFIPEIESGLKFVRVADQETLKVFSDIIVAIGGHPKCYENIYRHIPAELLEENAPLQMYVAYEREKPAATGILVLDGELAGLYYIATTPEKRGKGYGTAMTEHLLTLAKKKGYLLAGLEASHEGLNLYKRLGFEEVAVFEEFQLD